MEEPQHNQTAAEDLVALEATFSNDVARIGQLHISPDIETALADTGQEFCQVRARRLACEQELGQNLHTMQMQGVAQIDIDTDYTINALKQQIEAHKDNVQILYTSLHIRLKAALNASSNPVNRAVATMYERVSKERSAVLHYDGGERAKYLQTLHRKYLVYDAFFNKIRNNHAKKRGYTMLGQRNMAVQYQEISSEINKTFHVWCQNPQHGKPADLPDPYFPLSISRLSIEKILEVIGRIEHEFLKPLEARYGVEYRLMKLRNTLIDEYEKRVEQLLKDYVERIKSEYGAGHGQAN
ncbi:hypothetical protein [Conchiformibius steedae]|uniref:hypothetical protein n=1 Tax=Conchiformibius steedae TaxID=153493 RepID=UPI0026F194BB|nr:hypothetical protein [Conchiformibius steedae]